MGTENVRVGTAQVWFGDTPVDLGFTKGGVEFEMSTDTYKVTVDQFGDTEVNEIITKRSCMARCPLAETTLDNLAVMPGATKIVDVSGPEDDRVDVDSAIGTDLLTGAELLTLHPSTLQSSDLSEDIGIPKANTAGNVDFMYKLDEERIFNFEFVGYPDSSNSNLLFYYGDKDAT